MSSLDGRSVYYVRPAEYRGRHGFHIGERVIGNKGGWRISIFVDTREQAERIRDAYTAAEARHITRDERDVIVHVAMGGDWVWWANHVATA